MVLGACRMEMKKVGMAERTTLIRTKRPSHDSMRAFHPSSRRSTFSITNCQSCIETHPVDSSMPRYLLGRDLRGVARIVEHRTGSSSGISTVTSMDSSRLRQRPKKFEKMFSIVDTFFVACVVPSSRNIVSSAYWRS